MISIGCVGHRRFDPFPSIDLIKQHLERITGWDGDLHRLSRSSICAVEQLANCRNPRGLVLRFQRQACQLDNSLRSMLARQFLHLGENLGAPPGLPLWPFRNFNFSFSLLLACFQATL
jgi:hypothetical protein